MCVQTCPSETLVLVDRRGLTYVCRQELFRIQESLFPHQYARVALPPPASDVLSFRGPIRLLFRNSEGFLAVFSAAFLACTQWYKFMSKDLNFALEISCGGRGQTHVGGTTKKREISRTSWLRNLHHWVHADMVCLSCYYPFQVCSSV